MKKFDQPTNLVNFLTVEQSRIMDIQVKIMKKLFLKRNKFICRDSLNVVQIYNNWDSYFFDNFDDVKKQNENVFYPHNMKINGYF